MRHGAGQGKYRQILGKARPHQVATCLGQTRAYIENRPLRVVYHKIPYSKRAKGGLFEKLAFQYVDAFSGP